MPSRLCDAGRFSGDRRGRPRREPASDSSPSPTIAGYHRRMARHRHRRRVHRALESFTRRQWLLIGLAMAAVCGIAAFTVMATAPTTTRTPVSAPPLAPAEGQRSSSSAAAPTTPVTVHLIIPAGHIDLPVVEGDGVTVPLNLAMHYPGTAQPGQGSNALFYAHAQRGMFQGLYALHVGDAVTVTRADGSSLPYHIIAFKKIAYNDRTVLKPTPFDQITLLTCTSYDPFTPRFIALATPVATSVH